MKMEKQLKGILNSISGNVLAIGIKDEKLIKVLDDNKKINNCTLLNNSDDSDTDEGYCAKTINIRHLRKRFKKKKTNYIVGNISVLDKYLKYFIKDSIFISCNTIYLYGKLNDEKLDNLIKKYKRYNVDIIINKNKQEFLVAIECSRANPNFFKDLYYFISDTVSDVITIFSDILTN